MRGRAVVGLGRGVGGGRILAIASAVALGGCHRASPRVTLEIDSAWPGTSAAEIARRVTTPIERVLGEMPHIVGVTSVSRAGRSVVRVEIEGERDGALGEVRSALERSMRLLPAELPLPPTVAEAGPVVGRYPVARDRAREVKRLLERLPGVVLVETCGVAARQLEVVVDARRLADRGLAISDVAAALRTTDVASAGRLVAGDHDVRLSVNGARDEDLPQIAIAQRDGVVVHLSDVALVRESIATPECALVPRDEVELEVHALRRSAVDGVPLTAAPAGPELVGQLDPGLTPDIASLRVAEAIGSTAALAEIRGSDLVVRGATPGVVQRLRKTVGVASLGERTATVHVSGADPHQVADAARAIAQRLRAGDQLVVTHGLATTTTQTFDVDRDRAAALGVTSAAISETLAARDGFIVSTLSTPTESLPIVLRADTAQDLLVHAGGGAVVPLSSVVRVTEAAAPLEVLHRAQLPDVDLEVRGDPRAAIGSVPVGVRVDVD